MRSNSDAVTVFANGPGWRLDCFYPYCKLKDCEIFSGHRATREEHRLFVGIFKPGIDISGEGNPRSIVEIIGTLVESQLLFRTRQRDQGSLCHLFFRYPRTDSVRAAGPLRGECPPWFVEGAACDSLKMQSASGILGGIVLDYLGTRLKRPTLDPESSDTGWLRRSLCLFSRLDDCKTL